MSNLYELSQALENFEYEFDEETGEFLNADELDSLVADRDEKILNCILFMLNTQAEAEALKNEKLKLGKRQAQKERSFESMKRYVSNCLGGLPWKSHDGVHKVSYRKSEVVTVPENVFDLDDEYLTYKEPTPNKEAIKKAIKAGIEVKGCELVEKKNIQIV